jgi:hypothetical protein
VRVCVLPPPPKKKPSGWHALPMESWVQDAKTAVRATPQWQGLMHAVHTALAAEMAQEGVRDFSTLPLDHQAFLLGRVERGLVSSPEFTGFQAAVGRELDQARDSSPSSPRAAARCPSTSLKCTQAVVIAVVVVVASPCRRGLCCVLVRTR